MYLIRLCRNLASKSFPRTRGDVPRAPWRVKRCTRLPPHARGCTCFPRHEPGPGRASPARAGMYRRRRPRSISGPGFPRTRGDVPPCSLPGRYPSSLPPHARGCTRKLDPRVVHVVASPARAGMYRFSEAWESLDAGFPRTRGDVPRGGNRHIAIYRLPPHARGCTRAIPTSWRRLSASPARAGMYLRWHYRDRPAGGFPRTRGDVPAARPGPGA